MTQHANMVKVAAASPGTSTITVGSAVSGFRTFGTAFGAADATVAGVRIEDASDPTIWEIAKSCAYTHSGTTLTRGTLESSSTGSVVDFTGSVVVSVIETADFGRRMESAGLQTVAASVTTANVTGVVGTLHALDLSGLTANLTFTLPTTFAVDDRIGIVITTGDASYELLVTAGSGDTLNGIAGGTEWSRLFITGESLVFRATAADTWVIDVGGDGRIPQKSLLTLTTQCDGESATALTRPTAAATPGLWTATTDIGGGCVAASDRINIRRTGSGVIYLCGRHKDAAADQKYLSLIVSKNAGETIEAVAYSQSPAASQTMATRSQPTTLTAGDYLVFKYQSQDGGLGLLGTSNYTQFGWTETL